MSREPFSQWRDEISSELLIAEQEAEATRAALAEAEATAPGLVARYRQAAAAINEGLEERERQALAPALYSRLEELRTIANAAAGRVTGAEQRVKSALWKLESLRAALSQIDQVIERQRTVEEHHAEAATA